MQLSIQYIYIYIYNYYLFFVKGMQVRYLVELVRRAQRLANDMGKKSDTKIMRHIRGRCTGLMYGRFKLHMTGVMHHVCLPSQCLN